MNDLSRLYRWLLLGTSLATLLFLSVAAVQENFFSQWQVLQRQYRAILKQKATDARGQELYRNFEIELRQVSVPELRAVDRCVTCHVGIDDPRMTDVRQPFAVHPGDILEHHPVDRFGCTVCHQGQGPATNFRDAKAEDVYWDYPLLTAELTQSSCLACHDPEKLPAKQVELLLAGQKLYQEKSCGSCHQLKGRGGNLGAALDDVGSKTRHQLTMVNIEPPHTTWRWHVAHFRDPAGIVPGSQMVVPPISDQEALALTVYMLALRRRDVPESYLAPDKIEEKYRELHPEPLVGEQIYTAYCAACHHPQGQGSNFPALGVRAPAIGSSDFIDVASDQFILATLEAGRSERKMPAFAAAKGTLSADEAQGLVAFLRQRAPRAPSLAEVERAASDRALGEQLYQAECAACHGDRGQGTPLGSPLATADRRAAGRAALHRALAEGVPGTAMPRYTRFTAAELRSLIDYTASLPTVPGSRARWELGQGDPNAGRELFQKICAGCHGDQGQGKTGPALASHGFQKAATEAFVAATVVRGRAGTPMPAFGRASVNYPRLTAQEVLDLGAFVKRGLGVKLQASQPATQPKTGD
ncbi:MAG TPA: c-type cytochrome [Candidatus Xenobia bacterium]|nr:c-type cytochrome [Candidatus Xenobia bacterium]